MNTEELLRQAMIYLILVVFTLLVFTAGVMVGTFWFTDLIPSGPAPINL